MLKERNAKKEKRFAKKEKRNDLIYRIFSLVFESETLLINSASTS